MQEKMRPAIANVTPNCHRNTFRGKLALFSNSCQSLFLKNSQLLSLKSKFCLALFTLLEALTKKIIRWPEFQASFHIHFAWIGASIRGKNYKGCLGLSKIEIISFYCHLSFRKQKKKFFFFHFAYSP